MDLTPEYIKMCEKMQKLGPVKIPAGRIEESDCNDKDCGSFYYLPKSGVSEVLHWDNDEGRYMIGNYHDNLDGIFWLPRIDQLCEMSGLTWTTFDGKCAEEAGAHCWNYHRDKFPKVERTVSKEIAGLLVVMKEKHGRKWNGEEWVN